MLQIKTFTFNAFQENTYLIINERNECWIVDPGMYDTNETNFFINYVTDQNLKPQAIINTHTHLDHIFGVQACIDKWKIPFLIHSKEIPVLNAAAGSAMLFGFDSISIPQPTSYLNENEKLLLGNDELEIRFTPGHSPGSVIFYNASGKWLIGGDVLFNGSIGRTDLPGGDHNTLLKSVRTQLFSLPNETIVYSGHGAQTTIGNEKLYNPFFN